MLASCTSSWARSCVLRCHRQRRRCRRQVQQLDDSQFDDWMRGTPAQAATLMKPYAGAIEAWEVGAEVGNVKNNRPELMERVGLL
jgi:putative SOS response-associated peptidase YedK